MKQQINFDCTYIEHECRNLSHIYFIVYNIIFQSSLKISINQRLFIMKRQIANWSQSQQIKFLQCIPHLKIFLQVNRNDTFVNQLIDHIPRLSILQIFNKQVNLGYHQQQQYKLKYADQKQSHQAFIKAWKIIKSINQPYIRRIRRQLTTSHRIRAQRRNDLIKRKRKQKLLSVIDMVKKKKIEQWQKKGQFLVMLTQINNYGYIVWYSTKQMQTLEGTDNILYFITTKCRNQYFSQHQILQKGFLNINWDNCLSNVKILKGKDFEIYDLQQLNIVIVEHKKDMKNIYHAQDDLLALTGQSINYQIAQKCALRHFQSFI